MPEIRELADRPDGKKLRGYENQEDSDVYMKTASAANVSPEFVSLISNLKVEYGWVLDELAKR